MKSFNLLHIQGRLQKGFTVVELMVAAALSMIIIIAALSVMIASHKAYQAEEEQSYVQQVARSVIDFMSADVMRAGLGCMDQQSSDVDTEAEYVFPVGSSNSSNYSDVLTFAANDGGLTYVTTEIDFAPGNTYTFAVIPGTLSLFEYNDKVWFFSLDRVYQGEGTVRTVDDNAGSMGIFVDSTVSGTGVKLAQNEIITEKPRFITYLVVQDPNGGPAGDLYRCWSYNTSNQCPCNGAQNCEDAVIATDIEDFQVSVMLDGDNSWRADFDWDNIAGLDSNGNGVEDRREIRALKLEVLVRGPAMMEDYTGPSSFNLGNRTINLQGDELHHMRQHMSTVVVLENMGL